MERKSIIAGFCLSGVGKVLSSIGMILLFTLHPTQAETSEEGVATPLKTVIGRGTYLDSNNAGCTVTASNSAFARNNAIKNAVAQCNSEVSLLSAWAYRQICYESNHILVIDASAEFACQEG